MKYLIAFTIILLFALTNNNTHSLQAQTIPEQPKTYLPYIEGKLNDTLYFAQKGYSISNWNNNKIIFTDDIPFVDYGGSIGIQFNPATVAQYGLSLYNLYIEENNQDALIKFFKQVAYLETHGNLLNDNTIVYKYNFDEHSYNLKAGWVSSLAQGNVLSLLTRAYLLDGNNTHLEIANKVYNGMLLPVSNGGTFRTTPEGLIWFEEVPTKQPSLILNGFMFAIIGIYEYADVANDANAKLIFNESLKTFDRTVFYYDTNDWILYDRVAFRRVSPGYVAIHARLAEHLYEITKDEYYLNLANKWFGYLIKKGN